MPTGWDQTQIGKFIVKDRLVAFVLFVVLGVLSAVSVNGTRSATAAAEKAKIAAEAGIKLQDCLTPGKECYRLAQQNAIAQRAYFNSLVQAVGVCLVETPPALSTTDTKTYEKSISDCVISHTPINPNPPTK